MSAATHLPARKAGGWRRCPTCIGGTHICTGPVGDSQGDLHGTCTAPRAGRHGRAARPRAVDIPKGQKVLDEGQQVRRCPAYVPSLAPI